MYLTGVAYGVWQMKWRCLLLLLVSTAAAIALTFNVSLAKWTIRAKPLSFGVAATQVLVDSGRSPLGDVTVLTQDIDLLAENIAVIGRTSQVLDAVAKSVGVAPSRISTEAQLIQNVSFEESAALEAQRGEQIIDSGRRSPSCCGWTRRRSSCRSSRRRGPVVRRCGWRTRRPQRCPATSPRSSAAGGIRKPRSVILRQIGTAYGGTVDRHLAVSAAVLLAAFFFSMGVIALFANRRWRLGRPVAA